MVIEGEKKGKGREGKDAHNLLVSTLLSG